MHVRLLHNNNKTRNVIKIYYIVYIIGVNPKNEHLDIQIPSKIYHIYVHQNDKKLNKTIKYLQIYSKYV